jgi:hypothetical protein
MASDAGHAHVKRLAELRNSLEAQAQQRDISTLAAELARVAQELPRLDFGLLQSKGWLSRLSGKGRTAGAEFAAQFGRIDEATQQLASHAKSLQAQSTQQAARNDLTLLEVEVEFRAIDKIIDQGAHWLQDMRNQLKAREASENGEEARRQIKNDAARCEILVARLKKLRTVSSAGQSVHQQAQQAATRRLGIFNVLQQAMASDVREWRTRVGRLASLVEEGGSTSANPNEAMESHRELQLCVKQLVADCAQLQAHESAFADSLVALGAQLDAVGS